VLRRQNTSFNVTNQGRHCSHLPYITQSMSRDNSHITLSTSQRPMQVLRPFHFYSGIDHRPSIYWHFRCVKLVLENPSISSVNVATVAV